MIAKSGYTLVELLIVLLLLGLLMNQGLPPLRQWQQGRQADIVMDTLISQLALARSEAAALNRSVTLCPSRDGLRCGGDWSLGSLLFVDRNGDRVLNQDDRVLRVRSGDAPPGSLRWRAFGNRQAVQIDARGFLRYQSGNFTYCDPSGEPTLHRQLVVNAAGRARLARDSNGDGIVEDSQGRPLRCG
ncbi:MAG: GspH/FimT family protein [Pseudomonadales bacterium]|nr:GspH/FimT family protein [Pseudomonadales bacterium]MCP5330917.1 GspH/FimT family protein [Pseudomonadales bacterium]MCP5343297.1 GspH/FimT family protein [Pseudomonadales bacterium]